MTTQDLTDYETLPLYDVIKNLAKETKKPLAFWIYTIAKAACTEDEPSADSNAQPLMLRPDKNWKIQDGYEEIELDQTDHCSWMDDRFPGLRERGRDHINKLRGSSGYSSYQKKPIFIDWRLEFSALAWVFTECPRVPVDDGVFLGIDTDFKEEGIVLHRTDFRAWCEASDYALPRFWFGEDERQKPEQSGGKSKTSPPEQNSNRGRTKTDALKALMVKLVQNGCEPNVESVWLALLEECGKPGSCIVHGDKLEDRETKKGPVICWRTNNEKIKHLNKDALEVRLKRYREAGLIP